MRAFFQRYRATLLPLGVIVLLAGLMAFSYRDRPGVAANILLSGLTLGTLYFLMTSGLSLIFGLMDVLNFAHGLYFMLGAYLGHAIYANPRLWTNLLPLALAVLGGLLAGRVWLAAPARRLPGRLGWLLVAGLALAGVWGLEVAPLNLQPNIPTGDVQAADGVMWLRVLSLTAAGLLAGGLATPASGPAKPQLLRGLGGVALVARAAGLVPARLPLEAYLLGLSGNVRFGLALVVGAGSGALFGALTEWALVRPLYSRPIYQVLLTLGLVYVGTETLRYGWGPSGYLMEIPPLFNTRSPACKGADLWTALSNSCSTFDMLGRPFPTYRLFIIGLGVARFVTVWLVLTRTRVGMIIRAGVQDREMVQALGIDVQRVFTLVFAFGTALAALGGVAAAPFLGVSLGLGQEFQLQAFIAIVIGGMGSFTGSAAGALVLGLARAFGDQLVLAGIQVPGMTEALKASPSIARASTVLIMALVLLLRPAGLFGKKD